jgi:hypothetical protein
MKISKLCVLAGIPLVLAACEAEEAEIAEGPVLEEEADLAPARAPATGATTAAGEGGTRATINLQPLNDSGVTGEATFTSTGDQTQVVLRVTGAPANSTHPAHIHTGSCENQGGVAAPLESVSVDASGTGTSTSTVSIPLATVMDGQHYVQAHQAGGGQPITCGDIPTQNM